MTESINRISASGIKKYRKCKKQYWYKYFSDIEAPEEGEIEHFEVGNAVHDSIENVLQEEDVTSMSEEELLRTLRDEERSLDYNYEDSAKVQSCLETAASYISKFVTNITSVEDKMEMDVNGIDYIGYADLISDLFFKEESCNDVIVDWKTGQEIEEWEEKVQGGMYVKMFHEEHGRWPDAIQFVYLNEGNISTHYRISDGEVMWNDYKNEYWDEISKDVSNITNSLYNDDWEANPPDNCYFCDYKYACGDYVGSEDCSPHHIEIGGGI